MSVLVTADLHFSDNPRDAYRFTIIQTLIELIQKYNVKRLLILGDLTEVKDKHGAWLVNEMVNNMEMLAGWCPITILRGNHDGIDPYVPYFGFLRHISNIRFIILPTDMILKGLGKCLFLPHSSNYKKDWAMLRTDDESYDYIFAHNTFKGASGQHVQLDGIPTDIFRKDARVIAGDVHVPHDVGPITYVGSPYLIDFGDDFRPRMLLIKRNGDIKSIAVKGPQKRLLEVTAGKSMSAGKLTGGGQIQKGDILKIRVTLTPEQYAKWSEFKDGVLEWGKKFGYVIDRVEPVTEHTLKPREVSKVQRSAKTDEEVLLAYAASRGIDDRTLKAGRRLLG